MANLISISRRQALAVTAAGLTAVPAVAQAASGTPDPVFSAIDRQRTAEARLRAVLHDESEAEADFYAAQSMLPTPITREIEDKLGAEILASHEAAENEAGGAAEAAIWDLANTVPTTFAGLAAMMAYEREFADRELFNEKSMEAFHFSIEQAVCQFAGLPAPVLEGALAS